MQFDTGNGSELKDNRRGIEPTVIKKDIFEKLLESLLPQERTVVEMILEEDLTEEEVAKRLGLPVGTVKNIYHVRAKPKIRRHPWLKDIKKEDIL